MISWIQITFQKHFRTVFAILLAILIISFIFTIGAAPGIGRAEHEVLKRPFFGYNLGSQEDAQRITQDASLSVLLRAGYMALDAQQFQDYAERRVAALSLAHKLKMPAPTTEQLTEFIKTFRGFADEQGQFDPKKYSQFIGQLKANPQLTEMDVSRVLSDDYRVEQIQKKVGGPGYVLPSDVKNQLAQADSAWSLGVLTVDYATFNPTIQASDADVTKYFEDNAFRYEVAPQVVATYVEFAPASYMSDLVVKDEEVRAYYDTNPARFPKPAAPGKTDEKSPAIKLDAAASKTDSVADFEAVKPRVIASFKQDLAAKRAAKAAADFTVALYEQKLAANSPALDTFVTSSHLEQKSLPPLRRDAAPANLPIAADGFEQVFKLSEKRFFSDPLVGQNGSSVVLLWKETKPSYKPLLTEVKVKVQEDFVENEKRKRFAEFGKTIKAEVESAGKAGQPFEKAAASISESHQGHPKVEGKTYPSFTLRKPPQDIPYPVLGSLERLNQGQASDLLMAQDKGYVVLVQEKKVPSLSPDNPQYAQMQAQIARSSAGMSQSLAFSEVVANELAKSAPATR